MVPRPPGLVGLALNSPVPEGLGVVAPKKSKLLPKGWKLSLVINLLDMEP